jgi:type IV pilus assembly protein PilA
MKKGFTLVELLAVIVILAVILAIAVPGISNVIETATKNAFASDLHMVLKAIEYKKLEDNSFDSTTIDETNVKNLLNIDDSNYKSITVKKVDDSIYVTIVGQNKWKDLTATGTANDTSISNTVIDFVRGANNSILATGMTPIKWDGSTWVDTTENDPDWYNYDTTNKKWANARTEDGSMWVWIPRFIYKISNGWHSSTTGTIDIQFSKGIDDNWNKAVIGNINLDQTANASNNTWTNHPAFTFGSTELTGFWISKFEVSSSDPAAANGGDDVTTLKVKSVPNVVSWRGITLNNAFIVSRSMETDTTYGWDITGEGVDTHLMKNTEWGAVSYLSKSIYGKNDEVWVNNSNTYITGCAGSSVSAEISTTGCEYAYNTTNGLQASTTGNIYGVYDMSGGAFEYTAAYINNNHANLTANGNSVYTSDNKYKNVYGIGAIDDEANNYALAINQKGDAIYETSSSSIEASSWYGDHSYMSRTDNPWFKRGGYNYGSRAGLFEYYRTTGHVASYNGFRSIILVNTGL